MKTYFLVSLMFITSSVMAQRLRDSLFGGRLKVDTGKTFVSKDTGKYVAQKSTMQVHPLQLQRQQQPHRRILQKL